MAEKESTVLIYGTSLSGLRVAYALGKMGYKCILLNRGAYVDEYRNQLLSQLPLDFCWVCGVMPQRMFIGLGALEVFYNAQLLEIKGRPGSFRIKFKKRDPLVNNFACTECEACIRACPEEKQTAEGKRRAIYCLPKVGWENVFILDEDICTECGLCEKACPTGALKLKRPVETIEMKAGAIVLAPEFDEPGQEELSLFKYGVYQNVVKNSDLARRSLLTNFIRSSLARPSDEAIPQKVAIIVTPQYNIPGVEYENYNCSVSAIYRALKIRDLLPETEVAVFLQE
ncbi:4Fe-4S binding protein, partial [Thermosulfuriphilus sp.]